MSETILYILNGMDGGKHLMTSDGRPITFRDSQKAEEYCLNMAIGCSAPPDTFRTTTEKPAQSVA